MTTHQIHNLADFNDLKAYADSGGLVAPTVEVSSQSCTITTKDEKFHIDLPKFGVEERNSIHTWLRPFRYKQLATTIKSWQTIDAQNELIYGKDPTTHVVNVEAKDGTLELYIERNGVVTVETRPYRPYMLAPRAYDQGFKKLGGNLHYNHIKTYPTKAALWNDKNKYRMADLFHISNDKEAAMVMTGITQYKGMKVDDVSRLHFDLETIGLLEAPEHRILLISTTLVKNGTTTKRLFSVDEYSDDAYMLFTFCDYVRTVNPSIISGFNIFGFDLPYLQIVADKHEVDLSLGRDDSNLRFDKRTSKFRKDGSQDYDYTRAHIYGRDIVDMMFVAYHFDFARKYERYALKSIIAQEGLEKPGRVFYDASKIRENWSDPSERPKIKAYCIDDADDSEALYKLMISPYFYFTQHIPKSFQMINYSATGSQLNSFLVRSYLQEGHSIPSADEAERFPGAISDGFPGIYSNVFKVDVASLYPSIMLQYSIENKAKDPKSHFLKMVGYFTKQRLEDKKKAKETGDRYYKELEQSRKIAINSAYGLLGATGLHFNYPVGAAKVTEYGREILKTAIKWATGRDYVEKVKEDEEIHENSIKTS